MNNPSRTTHLSPSGRRRPSIDYDALRNLKRTPEEALRMALRGIDDASPTADFQRESILLSLHPSDPLREVWFEETAPLEARAELHLSGPTVRGHSADAGQVSRLIESINLAVRRDSSSRLSPRREKLPKSTLFVESFAPGSLEIVLKAAPVEAPKSRADERPLDGVPLTRHIISDSLTTVMSVLTAASSDAVPEALDTQGLNGKAFSALKEAAQAVIGETWDIIGTVTQRNHAPVPIKFTPRGAHRLKSALEAQESEPTIHEVTGTMAGFRESTGLVWIDVAGREISMRAVENELWRQARALSPDPDQLLRVRYSEVVRGFDGQRVSASRTLIHIEPVR